MAQGGAIFPPLEQRPIKDTICLFDVDGTLTPARGVGIPGSHEFLGLSSNSKPSIG